MNVITIAGVLGRDPETRQVGDTSVTEVSVAVRREYAGKGPYTDWFRCSVWERSGGKFLADYGRKGSAVVVTGRMQAREYQDRDGNKRVAWELIAERVELPRGNGGGEQRSKPEGQRSGRDIEREADAKRGGFSDDEVPF